MPVKARRAKRLLVARRWNDSTEKATILLLRREAEAAILDDSIFPADPLAGP